MIRIGRANTRSANKVHFKVPCKITRIYEHSLYYNGTKLWDALPENIQKSDNITLFKNGINNCYLPKSTMTYYVYIYGLIGIITMCNYNLFPWNMEHRYDDPCVKINIYIYSSCYYTISTLSGRLGG